MVTTRPYSVLRRAPQLEEETRKARAKEIAEGGVVVESLGLSNSSLSNFSSIFIYSCPLSRC